jgi:hypothetical protein
MNHDPGNDLCASSPFEGCICHLSGAEQLALRSSAQQSRTRLSATGYQGEVDDALEVQDD